ncbi:MAG: leucine-rich repeat domain-containing protein [Clostridia bacterium]|nr:leucine-rich repeat domain-containing protein [Clostridia bacterium]
MKKKLLFGILMVAIFTCFFAISVNAEWIDGIDYTLDAKNMTATFSATNRTECTLTEVIIPEKVIGADGNEYTVTSIADRSIGHQDSGKGNTYIVELYIPETVTYLGAQLVRNCTNLKTVKIDASVAKLSAGDFWNCPLLEELDLSGMKSLTTLDQITVSTPKLKTVKLPSSLVTIGGKAFQSCGSLTSIVIPNGVTTIGSNTFQSTKIETLVLPASLTSVGGAAFHSLSTVKTLVFGNTSFDGWSTNVTFNGVNPDIIFFAGEDPTTLTNHYTQWNQYATMSYADYLLDPSSAGAKTIVYDTENCSCGYIRTNEEPTFNFTGFLDELTYSKICAHCGDTDVTKTVAPMFTCLGWTAQIDGGAVSIRYQANRASIAEYTSETGNVVEYGMYATIKNVLGDNEIIGENGEAGEGAVMVSLSSAFVNLEIKLLGIGDDQKDTLFAIGAFVKETSNEVAEYKLLEYASPKDGDKYYFTSFNEIIENN